MLSKMPLSKRLTLLVAASLLTLLNFSTSLIAGQVVNSTNGEYYVSVPPTSTPVPVLVFLHGMGNDQDQGRRIFDAYTNQAKLVLVSPTGGSQNKSWMMGSGPSVRRRVEEVLSKYKNADRNNIFLVGYSAGGGVAYAFGPADSSFYRGMCIVNAPYQPGIISLQGKLPVYLLECEGDPNKVGAEMAKRYMESSGFDVKYDVIPASRGGTSHAYPTSVASPMIIKWIQDSAKKASDDSVNDTDSYNNYESGTTSDSGNTNTPGNSSDPTNSSNPDYASTTDNNSTSGTTSDSNDTSSSESTPNLNNNPDPTTTLGSGSTSTQNNTPPSASTYEAGSTSGITIIGRVLGLLVLLFTTVTLLILIVQTAPTQITLLIKKIFK